MSECVVKRALISVSDKTGAVEFARGLRELGAEIISTSSTAARLSEAGVPVTRVSDVTGFPEILGGRVKTLHPAIHGGILARREDAEHMKTIGDLGIAPIDLVAVNLYPFREAAAKKLPFESLIEEIDIGGPSLVRSAAKNHEDVIVIVNPSDYAPVLAALRRDGDCPSKERRRLAGAAFRHTAEYDACIAKVMDASFEALFAEKVSDLRYGENPGQSAALYARGEGDSFIRSRQLQGKELSYNNWLDADGAFRVARELKICGLGKPAAVIVKHANPCGAAFGLTAQEAFERAYACDERSAFGGIAAFTDPVNGQLAERLAEIFLEVILAPSFDDDARAALLRKTNLRLLEVDDDAWDKMDEDEWRSIEGGFLVQGRDAQEEGSNAALAARWRERVVTRRVPSASEMADLLFAWRLVKYVKSNAIVLARDGATVGIGTGQPSRLGSAEIALRHAGMKAAGAVMASDAFFPFGDVVKYAGEAGVTAVVQSGGSIRDAESTAAADEHGMAMIHTGTRHFRH
ncbi:MAG: bifunctional phosphoribosylaminoimidazolecarboxamide formyltransferase/IMP cyclohydrolase [Synergistaceae bacterium]|jgi:phosphoribosylaminoimidazolecarboxamide formyltransferase/IMP cyclohydrolase|nr:bifunctional phosphoribosylaminoimidazolecarboxamide formyltransferase/IMP cyclohydrolase [Synergistaceae bacterium]